MRKRFAALGLCFATTLGGVAVAAPPASAGPEDVVPYVTTLPGWCIDATYWAGGLPNAVVYCAFAGVNTVWVATS